MHLQGPTASQHVRLVLPVQHGGLLDEEDTADGRGALGQPPVVHHDTRDRDRHAKERPIEHRRAPRDEILRQEAAKLVDGEMLEALPPQKGRVDGPEVVSDDGEIRVHERRVVRADGGLVRLGQLQLSLQLVGPPHIVLVRQGHLGRASLGRVVEECSEARDRAQIAAPVPQQTDAAVQRRKLLDDANGGVRRPVVANEQRPVRQGLRPDALDLLGDVPGAAIRAEQNAERRRASS